MPETSQPAEQAEAWPYGTLESEVRTYSRRFPDIFARAFGHRMWDTRGREFVDFIDGAGALNYGHNHPEIKAAILGYLAEDGPIQSLDLNTPAKGRFLKTLRDVVLAPRGLDHVVQFTGPTGANTVEAAFKVARRATGRSTVIAFTNGFHGGSIGALAASSNLGKRRAAGVPLHDVVHLPYEGYLDGSFDTAAYLRAVLDDPSSGVDAPAAIVLETVQGEGGLAAASPRWLAQVARIAAEHGALLILDDIQAGCGRTGRFFSFEEAGIVPDIICLAKSISGYGLPMGLTLIRPQYDVLRPGEHAGTFRGQNLSYVAGAAALDLWSRPGFVEALDARCLEFDRRLLAWEKRFAGIGLHAKGRGMMRGLGFADADAAAAVSRRAYERRLLVETSGARSQVLKIMPPIVISAADLADGLNLLEDALADHAAGSGEG
jgi:diaminobutyrate-2-oxoglutarate transaminase